MCLVNKPDDVKKFLKKKGKQKTISAWKVFRVEDKYTIDCMVHCLYSKIYGHLKWKSGWNKSDSKAGTVQTRLKEINRGIHVYLSKPSLFGIPGNCRLVRVQCYISDLIGVGVHNNGLSRSLQAVFKKAYLSKSEYKKALGGE